MYNTCFSSKDMLMRVMAQDLPPGSSLVEKVNFDFLSPVASVLGKLDGMLTSHT